MPTEIWGYIIPGVAAIAVATIEAAAAIRRKKDKEDNDAYRKHREEKEQAHQELLLHLLNGVNAAIGLSEAVAHAMQRGHTNGDTEAALKYASEVKRKQKEFLAQQGVHNIVE